MAIKDLPIFGQYNKQQFIQFCPEDLANWTLIPNEQSKKKFAFYPMLGRRHINFQNINLFIFDFVPRFIYKSVNFFYVFVGNKVFRYDTNFSNIQLAPANYNTNVGPIYFDYLVAPTYTLAIFTDGNSMWVHNENTDNTVQITDNNLPKNTTAFAVFGNRVVATGKNMAQISLSQINLGPLLGPGLLNIDPATAFTVNGQSLFAYETETIVNFGVLHNTLYVFLQSTTSVWSNNPSQFALVGGGVAQFPWTKNKTYNFDYGLAGPFTLSIDFGRMVWLGNNQEGLTQIVGSSGEQPKPISTKAIDNLLGRDAIENTLSPFLAPDASGFLYQYQNTVYYRLSSGQFFNFGILDDERAANSIEFNFDTGTWGRCIEVNGERNRIHQHIYFSNRHLVTLVEDTTIYEMSGQFFTNEVRSSTQPNAQAPDAYIAQPFRYERITTILSEPDYGEFLTDFVQIDFVWGDQTFIHSDAPFENTIYVIDEDGTMLVTEDGAFIITEDSNFPTINEQTYNAWFKPHLELYYSDDGGISYLTADNREFSQLGTYSWRMRWYELGPSRNRTYKLIAVSPSPIVILGAITDVRRASGGAA